MTFDRHLLIGLVWLAAAGCGNYSNSDLEFMNALPKSDLLQVEIPRVSAVDIANEAELSRLTHKTTRDSNGFLGALTTMVDWIRSHPPTSRTPDSRTWGPYAADKNQVRNLDWQTRMVVERSPLVADQFDYKIQLHKVGTGDVWLPFITGFFHVSETVRRGTGQIAIETAALRMEGFDISDLVDLDSLVIDYDTVDDPVWIKLTWKALSGAMFVYEYKSTFAGQGQMTFDLYGDVIVTTTGAVEHMNVTSQWLPSGAGRATLTVVSGDGAGSMQQTCWDSSFKATYNDKPWAPPAEQVPGDPADPAVCPAISAL